MEDVWSWLTTLATSGDWPSSLPLAAAASKSIILTADCTAGSTTAPLVTFSISLHGFHPSNTSKTLWLSDPFPLSTPHFSLLLHLLNQVIALSPSASSDLLHNIHSPSITTSLAASPELPTLLSLSLICRLFFLCARDAPAEAGFLFFHSLQPAALARSLDCRNALRTFLTAAGADREQRLMRSLGYMLAKWCLLRDLGGAKWCLLRDLGGGGDASSTSVARVAVCPVYATEAYGLWVLKSYAPVLAMDLSGGGGGGSATALECTLRYALAHQQLEAVIQLEYCVSMRDPRFIRVCVRVDNIRLHVVRLGFGRDEYEGMEGERHFPSRVKVWVGPEVGSAYALGPSLGRSTVNLERTVELTRVVKGSLGFGDTSTKANGVRAKTRESTRARVSSWRWEQEADGSAGVVEGVLCDATTGEEVATWRGGNGGGSKQRDPRGGMRRRYSGFGRAFSKGGGLVVAGDEMGEEMMWRVGREMEGRVMKWTMGLKVWVSYFPNEVRSGYFETRLVEWREEVDLPLVETMEFLRHQL